MTANGKVDRQRLQEQAAGLVAGDLTTASASSAFHSATEQIVANVFETVLQLPPGEERKREIWEYMCALSPFFIFLKFFLFISL
jgi:hypothetical protein